MKSVSFLLIVIEELGGMNEWLAVLLMMMNGSKQGNRMGGFHQRENRMLVPVLVWGNGKRNSNAQRGKGLLLFIYCVFSCPSLQVVS